MSAAEMVENLARDYGEDAVAQALRLEIEVRRTAGPIAARPYLEAAILLCRGR